MSKTIIEAANIWEGQDLGIANTDEEIIAYFKNRIRPRILQAIGVVDLESVARAVFVAAMSDEDLAERIIKGDTLIRKLMKS